MNTGVGQTNWDAGKFMIAKNTDPASIFHNQLDVTNIGAMGASQGASCAINALIKSGGVIKTVIPIELPAQIWCSTLINCTDTSHLTTLSVFFVDGSLDPVSPPDQDASPTGLQSIAAYYSAVPAVVVADYREAALGVKADLCVRPGPVIHQTVDPGNDGPVIAAIADISTAAELLRPV